MRRTWIKFLVKRFVHEIEIFAHKNALCLMKFVLILPFVGIIVDNAELIPNKTVQQLSRNVK